MSWSIGRKLKKVPGPSNTNVVATAQHQMDRIVSIANKKHENALKVDGIPMYVWLKGRAGSVCTCHSELQKSNVTHAPVQPKEDASSYSYTVVEETEIDNTLQKFREVKSDITDLQLLDYTFDSEVLGTGEAKVTPAIQKALTNLSLPNSSYDGDDDLTVSAVESSLPKDRILDSILANSQPNPTQDDSASRHDARQTINKADEFLFYGGEHTKCGICFSTGWTDAYQLVNGQRIVLDASAARPFNLKGFLVVTKNKPHTFELTEYHKSAYIEWYFEGPRFFNDVLLIKVRNNTGYTRGLKLIFKPAHGAGSWEDFSIDNMKLRSGLDNRLLIRAIPVQGNSDFQLTHVEIVFQYTTPILGQMPQIEDQLGYQYPDGLITSTIELPASVSYITSGSVIYDRKYGKVWRVTEASVNMTASRQIFNNTLQVRMVQHYEPAYLLHLFDKPNLQLNYRGEPELNQGIRNR